MLIVSQDESLSVILLLFTVIYGFRTLLMIMVAGFQVRVHLQQHCSEVDSGHAAFLCEFSVQVSEEVLDGFLVEGSNLSGAVVDHHKGLL